METLGDRLRKARSNKKLTQIEAAGLAKISNVMISRYESNDRRPEPVTLRKLARLYDVSVDWLLGNPEGKEDIDAENNTDVDVTRSLPDNVQLDMLEELLVENRITDEDGNPLSESKKAVMLAIVRDAMKKQSEQK